ncbi:uncharacterized protein HKW66_Vig0013250 [Vigna angularis]|uniref:Uncharacterized protein n=1 Tax=Phaseolus angularis TaxID=3914 RepID=A0A8T0LD55_PHAAN|nr:uncharacterized protein HKW66_Vig0013250 [Vigna angularis]
MKPGPRIILVLEGKFPLETLSERVDLRTLLLHDLEPDNIPLNLTFARNEQHVNLGLKHPGKRRFEEEEEEDGEEKEEEEVICYVEKKMRNTRKESGSMRHGRRAVWHDHVIAINAGWYGGAWVPWRGTIARGGN